MDGIILTALRNPFERVQPFLQHGPIVLASEYLDDDALPSVTMDNAAAAGMVTDHLISLGHERIAFINGPEHIILCRDRLDGYAQALEKSGLPVSDEWMVHGVLGTNLYVRQSTSTNL